MKCLTVLVLIGSFSHRNDASNDGTLSRSAWLSAVSRNGTRPPNATTSHARTRTRTAITTASPCNFYNTLCCEWSNIACSSLGRRFFNTAAILASTARRRRCIRNFVAGRSVPAAAAASPTAATASTVAANARVRSSKLLSRWSSHASWSSSTTVYAPSSDSGYAASTTPDGLSHAARPNAARHGARAQRHAILCWTQWPDALPDVRRTLRR